MNLVHFFYIIQLSSLSIEHASADFRVCIRMSMNTSFSHARQQYSSLRKDMLTSLRFENNFVSNIRPTSVYSCNAKFEISVSSKALHLSCGSILNIYGLF